MDIHQATQHRWQYILPHIGIEPRYLRNTHQPCPICGGKDRFRFDDKDGMGTYFCNQCGAGNGFTLMMKHLHCSFREAAQIAADILGERQPAFSSQNAPEAELQKQPAPDRIGQITEIWEAARPLSPSCPAVRYLERRGIDMRQLPDNLRYTPALAYWTTGNDGKPLHIGTYPALIGALETERGLMGLQRIYLQGEAKAQITHPQTGEALDCKKMLCRYPQSTSGAAVRLFPIEPGLPLVLCEGIETALAARELTGFPAWAAISANGIRRFEPPAHSPVWIYADHDTPHPVGFEAAHELAMRLKRQGIAANIIQSDTQGFDALDDLNAAKKAACTQKGTLCP